MACFVPNLGQWQHPARYVWRAGPTTVFVEDLGLGAGPARTTEARGRPDRRADPAKEETKTPRRGVAVRMSFLDASDEPDCTASRSCPATTTTSWATTRAAGVPMFRSTRDVRFEDLYAGIDVRLRQVDGHLEYDLLCDPGADLSAVVVKVEGADRLVIDKDGSLVIKTPLGPIRQPKPDDLGVPVGRYASRAVECALRLAGSHNRFGFVAPNWKSARALVVDPGLLWSTRLGRKSIGLKGGSMKLFGRRQPAW